MSKSLYSPPFGKICIYKAELIGNDVLQKCATLFSDHYGKWDPKGVKPGQSVKLSVDRIRREYLFNNETCFLVTAESENGNHLIGHAFACRYRFRHSLCQSGSFKSDFAVWITQLVVHSDFRCRGLATELLLKCCHSVDNIAWGICSSHPHAVRALEKATKREFELPKIAANSSALIQESGIQYFQNCKTEITSDRSVIKANFFIDHRNVNELIGQYIKEGRWNLGTLEDGDEFFAFTFDD